MENITCYLCGSENLSLIHKGTRDNPNINVIKCNDCTLIFLSSFSHISDKIYQNSKMHINNIDILEWRKNTNIDDKRRFDMLRDIIKDKNVLDVGCGNGGFLKYASSITKNLAGVEIEKKAVDYLRNEKIDRGSLTIKENLNDITNKYNIITLFHVIEHLKNPIEVINFLKNILDNNGEIILETPNSEDALLKLYNSNFFADFTYWSFHLFLFNIQTLSILAKKCGLSIKWIKQIQRYPLSNHLYWLSYGKPNGQSHFKVLNDNNLNVEYVKCLEKAGLCDTIIISLTKE